jgi:hypothetical protein
MTCSTLLPVDSLEFLFEESQVNCSALSHLRHLLHAEKTWNTATGTWHRSRAGAGALDSWKVSDPPDRISQDRLCFINSVFR